MANLEFCDKHNMVAYLKKPTGSEGFQEIVDFLNGSHIRYALTKNPTIYVSLIEKFWQTATVRTVDNGEQEITATVDGKEFTITEASVRRHLQLADVDGISVLPTTKFFDQHSLIGNMKRGFSGEHTPLFPSMLAIQAEEGEGSGHPSEPQPLPFTAQPTNEEPISNTSEHIPNVPDEAVYKEWDFRVERATTTAASLDAEQASGNINRTQSMAIPNVPLPQGIGVGGSLRCQEAMGGSIAQTRSERVLPTRDSPLPRVHTIGSDEDRRRLPEDQLGVLSTAKVLADAANTNVHTYIRRRRVVSTRSGGISTAGASMPVSTAGMVQEVNISIPSPVIVKDKGMVRVHEVAPSFTEEEWENIKARIKDKGRASELVNRSSQATIIDFAEAGSSKRAAEAELDHEGSKRQKRLMKL
ncbi:hypothetical protein Tco_0441221 [Tanacetum coccineum]